MRLISLVRNLFRPSRVERDLDEEVRAYAAMLADEHAGRGMDAALARRAALAEIGGVETLKEHIRERRAGSGIERCAQDVRFAMRMLRKSPAFTAVAVITLAIAIGATTAIFSVVDGVLLQPLPYPRADRIAFVWNHFSPQNMEHGPLSMADFLDWRAQNRAFEEPAAVRSVLFNLTGLTPPEQVPGSQVTANFFATMGVEPLLGRAFSPGDDAVASPSLAVISEDLWRRRFAASTAVIGQPLRIADTQAIIVGVMPRAFQFPRAGIDLWTNLKLQTPSRRAPFFLTGIARLKDGVSWQQAQDDTNRIAHGFEVSTNGAYRNATLPILPIREALVGNVRFPLLVMLAAVFAVLLIAAVNIANLLLARATTRRREIAIRLSIGARRSRIVRQLMTESLVLAAAGCAGGTAIAWGGLVLMRRWSAGVIPRMGNVGLNLQVFAFTAAVGVAVALLFGIAPALQASRVDLAAPLKEGARGTGSSGAARRLRGGLVVSELAISIVLLVCAGLLLRSFERLEHADTGVHAPGDNVLTVLVSPPHARYADARTQMVFFSRALEKVRALPGVESAAFSDSLAPVFWNNNDTFHVIGRPWSQEAFPSAPLPTVSDGYFQVLGVPLLRGRFFDAHDTASSPNVAIVSETFARRYFPNEDPIGHDVAPSAPDQKQPAYRIVGVVGDVKFAGLQSRPEAVWYSALAQGPDIPMFLLVRTPRPIAGLPTQIEDAIRSIDKDVIFTRESTLAGVVGDAVAQPRFRTSLLLLFAAIALLLAAVGTYGLIAYSVSQRGHEIGIRMALGARPADVVRQVVREGATLAFFGIGIGIPAAFAASRMVSSLLFDTQPLDGTTYVVVIAVLLSAVGWATVAPARRAARVDPLVALRHE